MTDAQKIIELRLALAPFADLLEYPDEAGFKPMELTVFPVDVSRAQAALKNTETA